MQRQEVYTYGQLILKTRLNLYLVSVINIFCVIQFQKFTMYLFYNLMYLYCSFVWEHVDLKLRKGALSSRIGHIYAFYSSPHIIAVPHTSLCCTLHSVVALVWFQWLMEQSLYKSMVNSLWANLFWKRDEPINWEESMCWWRHALCPPHLSPGYVRTGQGSIIGLPSIYQIVKCVKYIYQVEYCT